MKQSRAEAKTGILRFGGTQENSVIARDDLASPRFLLQTVVLLLVAALGFLWLCPGPYTTSLQCFARLGAGRGHAANVSCSCSHARSKVLHRQLREHTSTTF